MTHEEQYIAESGDKKPTESQYAYLSHYTEAIKLWYEHYTLWLSQRLERVEKENKLFPFDEEVEFILGRPNFTLIDIATVLRKNGQTIRTHAEEEQAACIYWLLTMYIKHGKSWRKEVGKFMDLTIKKAFNQE